jgi:hypothetical protein
VDVPSTTRGRLIAGFSALLLPRSVAARLGLVSIGGGRGLFWFVELDSVLTDLMLLLTMILLAAGIRRGAWRDPLLWYLIVVSIAITTALAYVVSNFGTLFRHREMMVATATLISMIAYRPRVRTSGGPVPQSVESQASPSLASFPNEISDQA